MTVSLLTHSKTPATQNTQLDLKSEVLRTAPKIMSHPFFKRHLGGIGYKNGCYPSKAFKNCTWIPCSLKRLKHWVVYSHCQAVKSTFEEFKQKSNASSNDFQTLMLRFTKDHTTLLAGDPILTEIHDNITTLLESSPSVKTMTERLFSRSLEYRQKIFDLQNERNFTITKEDYEMAGMWERYQNKTITRDCSAYAFYHMHETKAFPYVFQNRKENGDEKNEKIRDLQLKHGVEAKATIRKLQHFETLPLWKYELVSSPLPGDLVVYSQQDSPTQQPELVHFGIYVGLNMVRSKWYVGPVFTHAIDDIPLDYGNGYQIYRKKAEFQKFEIPTPLSEIGSVDFLKGKISKISEMLTTTSVSLVPKSLHGDRKLKFQSKVRSALKQLEALGAVLEPASANASKNDSEVKSPEQGGSTRAKIHLIVNNLFEEIPFDLSLL